MTTGLASCHDTSLASQPPGREGASNNKRTKLGMWRVGGVLGPQLVRRGFLWWCADLSCSCGRARQGVGTAGKGSSDNSDPEICHRKHPPLSPAPRPSSIAYSNTGTSRVAGLTAGFWVGMGLSLPARADYGASGRHSRPGGEGASLQPPTQSPAGAPQAGRSPSGGAQSHRGAKRGGRARPSGRAQADRGSERRASAAAGARAASTTRRPRGRAPAASRGCRSRRRT